MKGKIAGIGMACLVVVLFCGCVGLPQQNDTLSQSRYEALVRQSGDDENWLECHAIMFDRVRVVGWGEFLENSDSADFEEALIGAGSDELVNAYRELRDAWRYFVSGEGYFVGEDTWESVSEDIIGKMDRFLALYSAELKAHLENR